MRTTFVKERAFTCALLQIFRIFVSKAPLKLPPPSNFKVFAKLLERVTSQGKKMSYTCFLTWNPTKLRWRDLRSQLFFFSFSYLEKKTDISENTESFFPAQLLFRDNCCLVMLSSKKEDRVSAAAIIKFLAIN